MATSKFLRYFQQVSGAPLVGATIYLVPQELVYPNGALLLTAHPTRSGMYYRNEVPDGEYKIYIATGGDTEPTLWDSNIWIGENKLSLIADNFDATGKIVTAGLNDGAVTTAKIADDAVTKAKLNPDVAGAGLAQAVGGELMAAVDNVTLRFNDVALEVKDSGISTAKIAGNAVTTAKIADSNVTTAKIADDAVTKAKIASDIAGDGLTQNIDGSLSPVLDQTTIALDQGYSLGVVDGGISSAKIASGAVTTVKIADGAVTTAKIGTGAVTKDKINNDVIGTGLYMEGSGAVAVKIDNDTLIYDDVSLRVAPTGIDTTELADNAVTKEKVNSNVAGNGLGKNADGSLEVKVDSASGLEIASDLVRIKDSGIVKGKLEDYLVNVLDGLVDAHECCLDLDGQNEYLYRSLPTDIALFISSATAGNWTATGSPLPTITANLTTEPGSTNCIRIAATTSGQGIMKIGFLTVGKRYKCKIRVSGGAVNIGNAGNLSAYRTIGASSQWNAASFIFTATETGLYVTSAASGNIHVEYLTVTLDWGLDLNKDEEMIRHSKNRDFEQTLGAEKYSSFVNMSSNPYNTFSTSGTGYSVTKTQNTAYAGVATNAMFGNGKKYICSFTVANWSGTGALRVETNNSQASLSTQVSVANITSNHNGSYQFEFVNTGTVQYLALFNSPTDLCSYSIVNFSVKEIPNLVTNGTFDTDATGWGLSAGITYDGTNKCIDFNVADTKNMYQSYNFVVGKRYRASFEIKNYVSGDVAYKVNNTTPTTFFNSNGVKTVDWTQSTTYNYATIESKITGFVGKIDNVHIYELPEWIGTGNHTASYTTLDKYAGTGSLYISASGAGDSSSNHVKLSAVDKDDVVVGNKYTLESWAKLDPSGLIYGSNLATNGTNWTDSNGDGLADNTNKGAASGTNIATIVTGNGFSGNAQRLEVTADGSDHYLEIANTSMTSGKAYKVSFKYRANSGIVGSRGANQDFSTTLPANAGNAVSKTFYFISNGTGNLRFYMRRNSTYAVLAGDYIEIDDISIQEATVPTLTFQIGTKSVTYSPTLSFEKFVLNFEASASEVNQDLKMYLSSSGSVFVDNISLTQAYDMVLNVVHKQINTTDTKTIVSIVNCFNVVQVNNNAYTGYSSHIYQYANNNTFLNKYNYLTGIINRTDSRWYTYQNNVLAGGAYQGNPSTIGKAFTTDFFISKNGSSYWQGQIGPLQIIRFTNISQSNFDATTHRIGNTPTGGGAETVAYYNWKGSDLTTLKADKSPGANNDLTAVNISMLEDRKFVS